ncbi:MAG: preprotein translocase subunit SecE [Acidobacteria bacterium]|nr:preprotein translocase subunit SecE [Acidobacteriota bacterium]
MKKAFQFVNEVKAELKRTSWPSWLEVRGTTIVVIITVFIFSIYFYVVDLGLNWFLLHLLRFFGAE